MSLDKEDIIVTLYAKLRPHAVPVKQIGQLS